MLAQVHAERKRQKKVPGDGRIRRAGAGRKSVLPQDENVVWISLTPLTMTSPRSLTARLFRTASTMSPEMWVIWRWELSMTRPSLAAMTTTKKGLKVHVHINSKTYDIKRPIEESYQKRLARQVIFALELGQWNYLVKPANCCKLFFTHYLTLYLTDFILTFYKYW